MPDVKLKVNGMLYSGWKSVDILRSLDQPADTFALGLSDRWAGEENRRPIRIGSPIELFIDEQKLITGYVDDVNQEYDAAHRTIEVTGRSKLGDLIDCALPLSIEKSRFKRQTFLALSTRLAKHFGVDVVDEVGKFNPARIRDLDVGQRVFEFIEEMSREEAVLLVSNPDGNLVITRAGTRRLETALELGKNIKAASGRFSMKDRFSAYHGHAQLDGWDENHGALSAHIAGKTADVAVRFRPTVLLPEGATTTTGLRRRLEWQRNVNYGRSQQITYTVLGWYHSGGLWEPNWEVLIQDDWMNLHAVWWLISAVHFLLDENGMRTELTVMPREAFDLVPLPPPNEEDVW